MLCPAHALPGPQQRIPSRGARSHISMPSTSKQAKQATEEERVKKYIYPEKERLNWKIAVAVWSGAVSSACSSVGRPVLRFHMYHTFTPALGKPCAQVAIRKKRRSR